VNSVAAHPARNFATRSSGVEVLLEAVEQFEQ
jgi:hypothetical protein